MALTEVRLTEIRTWTVRIEYRMARSGSLEGRLGSGPEAGRGPANVGSAARVSPPDRGSGPSASSALPDVLNGSGLEGVGPTSWMFVGLEKAEL